MPMMTLDSWRLTEISENALHGKICSTSVCKTVVHWNVTVRQIL